MSSEWTPASTTAPAGEFDDQAVLLRIRCAGAGGTCGRLRAEIDAHARVRYRNVRCHNFDEYFHERPDVRAELSAAHARRDEATLAVRPFKPKTIAMKPQPRHRRVDRDLQQERYWEMFRASLDYATAAQEEEY